MKKKAERNITAYCATRNSQGVHEVVLVVDENDRVLFENHPEIRLQLIPPGHLSEVGKGGDWRTYNLFFTKKEALADYIRVEQGRIKQASEALAAVGAA